MQLGLYSIDSIIFDLFCDDLEFLDLPSGDERGYAVRKSSDADVFAGHIGHFCEVRVVAADLLVFVDVLLQFVLGNGGLLLADDIHQQSLLVLSGLVLLRVLGPPFHVSIVLFFELAPCLGSEDGHCLSFLLLLQFHCFPSLYILDQLANPILRRQSRAFFDGSE